jgi:nitroreductase
MEDQGRDVETARSDLAVDSASVETWDAIRTRRKLGEYGQRPIEEEKLNRILEAGRRAPSSRNQQRWHFVLVRDRDQLQRLSQVWRGAAHIADAPAAVGVVAPRSDDPGESASINFDLGQVVMSMMIAAADVGIGTRHAAVEDYDLAAEILDLPEGLRLTWMFGLGYPGDRPLSPVENPDRRDFDDVVHQERW